MFSGSTRSSLVGLKEATVTSEGPEPQKTKTEGISSTGLPDPSKDIFSKNGNDAGLMKSENQNKKAQSAVRAKSELLRKPKQAETGVTKRRGSKRHSSVALVSLRRTSQVEERKTSHQEMTKSTVKVSNRTNIRRGSRSKSGTAGRTVLSGRKVSQGSLDRESNAHKGRGSRTTVRRSNTDEAVKNLDSSSVSSNLAGKTTDKKSSNTRIEMSAHRSQDGKVKPVLAMGAPKLSEVGSSKSTFLTKKQGKPKAHEPSRSSSERGLSNEQQKSDSSSKESMTRSLSAIPNLEASTNNVEQKIVCPKTCDYGPDLTDVMPSTVEDKLKKDSSTLDSSPEDSKTGRVRKKKKITKTKYTTKAKTESKTGEPSKRSNADEEIKSTGSKVNSKAISSTTTSKAVPEKVNSILKKTSGSYVKQHKPKQASRVASVDITKKKNETSAESLKENSPKILDKIVQDSQDKPVKDSSTAISLKNGQKTSFSVHPKSKHVLETSVEDVSSLDTLDKTESDTEVVVQVHVPDIESSTDILNQEAVSEKNVVSTKESAQEMDTGKIAENQKDVHDVTTSLSTGEEIKEQTTEATKNSKDNLPTDAHYNSKTKCKKEEEVQTSSRKSLAENSEKLKNIVPRNSSDVLRVIKLSPKQSNESTQSPSQLPAHSESRQSQSKMSLPRAPFGPKPLGARVYRRKSIEGRPSRGSDLDLSAEGFGLSVKSSTIVAKPHHSSLQRMSSKLHSNLDKVDEGSSMETSVAEGHAKDSEQSLSSQQHGNEALAKSLSISRVTVVPKPSNSVAISENENHKSPKDNATSQNENSSTESQIKIPHNSRKFSTPCIFSTSFSDVVLGTQLLSNDSVKVEPSQNVSPHSSTASFGSSTSQTFSKRGPAVPSPPSTSKPGVTSPKVSRIVRNLSSRSSGKSLASLGSPDMSPTASFEIVKFSPQTSHGWVSSPTSSVKFLPPINARASKSSNKSNDSQKRRPRTTESLISQTESASSGSSTQSKKAAVLEIRRSSSGGLRVDGTSTTLIGLKPTTSGNSSKHAVIGF